MGRSLEYAEKLSLMVRIPTVSVREQEENGDTERFFRFQELLAELFPHLFGLAEKELFGASLLLRWPADCSANAGLPILLMSHQDVVEAGGGWRHEPFSGEITEAQDGVPARVWGRGTLDTKGNLFAILQAADELAAGGFRPARDIYFESACDEETDGRGAQAAAGALEERGIRLFMTLDEGGMIVRDPIGGAGGLFAMIGVGEKGCADLRFSARSEGGHASTPGRDTPLVRLGRFMTAAGKGRMFEARMSEVTVEMLRRMAPTMRGSMKFLCSHARGLRPLMERVMPGISPSANALLKTTLAFTMAGGSQGRNVLPQEAWVIGNMRYSNHQGRDASIAEARALAAKFGVETEVLDSGIESPVADYNGGPFRLVEEAVHEIFPGVRPAPYIMTGASDSRAFRRLTRSSLRFAPFTIDDQQLGSMHGVDENVDVETLPPAVDFFRYIIRRTCAAAEGASERTGQDV